MKTIMNLQNISDTTWLPHIMGKLTDMHYIQYADMPKFTQARSAAQIPLIISHDKALVQPQTLWFSQLLFQCPSDPFWEYESYRRMPLSSRSLDISIRALGARSLATSATTLASAPAPRPSRTPSSSSTAFRFVSWRRPDKGKIH
jgi:hypothetical protein